MNRPFPKRKNRDHGGEFLWLVSLSDLMILLFVFFVVLFSFSYPKMQAKDLEKLSAGVQGKSFTPAPPALDELQKRLLKWVVDKKLMESVSVEQKDDALILQIKEQVLFPSGSTQLSEASQDLVEKIGIVMGRIPAPYRIGVEGHTDSNPLRAKNRRERDNWDLSVQRALTVLRALDLSDETLERASVIGFGPMRPVALNEDSEGRTLAQNQAKNRRVTIRIY